jgi:hypothetical protein
VACVNGKPFWRRCRSSFVRSNHHLKRSESDSETHASGIGELISYRLRSGTIVVFRIIGHHTDRGGTSPVVEVLDWTGTSLASAQDIQNCPVRQGRIVDRIGPIPARVITQLVIGRLHERELPKDRVVRLGITSIPTQEVCGFGGAGWKTLDSSLQHFFGIE